MKFVLFLDGFLLRQTARLLAWVKGWLNLDRPRALHMAAVVMLAASFSDFLLGKASGLDFAICLLAFTVMWFCVFLPAGGGDVDPFQICLRFFFLLGFVVATARFAHRLTPDAGCDLIAAGAFAAYHYIRACGDPPEDKGARRRHALECFWLSGNPQVQLDPLARTAG